MELEATDAGERACRGANFGGVVGEGGDVVAVQGYGVGELAAGDLHAVAGVSGEADDRAVDHFALGFWQRDISYGRHISPSPRKILFIAVRSRREPLSSHLAQKS